MDLLDVCVFLIKVLDNITPPIGVFISFNLLTS